MEKNVEFRIHFGGRAELLINWMYRMGERGISQDGVLIAEDFAFSLLWLSPLAVFWYHCGDTDRHLNNVYLNNVVWRDRIHFSNLIIFSLHCA